MRPEGIRAIADRQGAYVGIYEPETVLRDPQGATFGIIKPEPAS